ncbi:Spy/CpxP family protein refolding chaperone [Halodesulfovibrio sp.]|uniref:Spy/CpxP family protein refolding chaperone n=1 Tax=Halodesulfovibrio sp. TaxID=1912772 RepID=UPI0025C583E1|nr:Spy/CpxP family protein refolding chaperone [Halodesulfovibrio sp.]
MKRLLIVCVAILAMALCSSAFAKGYSHGKMSPDERVAHMTKMLDLTPDQQTKIKDIIVRRDAEMKPLFKSLSEANDKEEQREIKIDILEQHQKYRDELNGVLTDEQAKKYQEYIQSRKMMHKNKK